MTTLSAKGVRGGSNGTQRWRGIAAAPGIALGPAFVYSVSKTDPALRRLPDERSTEAEKARLDTTLAAVRTDLLRLKAEAGTTVGSMLGKIFDAQVMIVDDAAIVSEVKSLIDNERIAAECAFSQVVGRAQESVTSATDPYLREMANDIESVKARVINHLTGISETLHRQLSGPAIIIASTITPSDIVSLNRELVLGIVTETGGQTSHTALLAKSLNIPAVVGVGLDVRGIRSGATVAVDGYDGVFILDPDPLTIAFIERKKKRTRSPWPKKYDSLRELPATTTDRHRVRLYANIDLAGEAKTVVQAGSDGVGLYRTEYLFFERGGFPTEKEQAKVYRQAVEALEGRPLIVRTFDLGSDKAIPGLMPEPNPALGLRGLRLSLRYPQSLMTQMRALLAASAFGPVWVMLPMVTDHDEFNAARDHWKEAMAELRRRKIEFDKETPLGIMIETPASVVLADDLAAKVDFFSIGTNDLIQYTLATDRGNRQVSRPDDKWHPALWRQIAAVVRSGHRAKRPVGLCGELATDFRATPFLVGLGLESLSSHPNVIPRLKSIVRSLKYADCREAVQDLLATTGVAEAKRIIDKFNRKVEG